MDYQALLHSVIDHLTSVKGPGSSGWFTAQCVFHDDRHPSLRFNEHGFRCFACGAHGSAIDLARKLGIDDLPKTREGLTLETLAVAKGFEPQLLSKLGVSNGVAGNGVSRRACVDIPYMNERGEVVSVQKRLSLDVDPRFNWRRGDSAIPYGLWLLRHARELRYVLLLEGASDCWAGWSHGIPCLGLPGATTWRSEHVGFLDGLTVFVWCEPGDAGKDFVRSVGRDIPSAKVIDAPPDAKDLADLMLVAGDAFVARVEHLKATAQRFEDRADSERGERAAQAYDQARELIEAPDVFERIATAIATSGYAGDVRPALIAYVVLVSRLLPRPNNVAYIAMSASGKNAAVDAALPFFPDHAFYVVRASSPKALIYNDASFAHRIVVLTEADSLPEEGPAASAIRSLITDAAMIYEVTEQNQSGQWVTRRITKRGPTGLLTTSTKPLQDQASTRMLNVSIPDSEDQTRKVLHAHAERFAGKAHHLDTSAWIAVQEWLTLAGPWDVTVPFAHQLADLIPARTVRVRRDFPQLLTVIQALALLRQHHRRRDDRGRIVAEADDYADARWLVEDIFTSTVSEGLTPAVKETAEAVTTLHRATGKPVSEPDLVQHFGLARSTVTDRVRRAARGGWIRNLAAKGNPAQLVPGESIPDGNALPEVRFVCADNPQDDPATRQVESSTASTPAGEGAGTTARPSGTAGSVPDEDPAASSASSSRAGQGAGSAGSIEGALAQTKHQMPWDALLEEAE